MKRLKKSAYTVENTTKGRLSAERTSAERSQWWPQLSFYAFQH